MASLFIPHRERGLPSKLDFRKRRELNEKSSKAAFFAAVRFRGSGFHLSGDTIMGAGESSRWLRLGFWRAGRGSLPFWKRRELTMPDSEILDDHVGDEYVQLLRQHQNQLFGYIFCMVRNFSDAEDVFQQTSLTLWDKFDEFTPGTSFMAWAKAVARNKTLTFLRTQRRERAKFSDEVLDQLSERELWSPEALEERLSALARCRQKLSELDQKLLAMCYGAAKSIRDVAGQLGRPVDSVYSSLSRIRRALYECIQRTLAMEHHA